MISLYLQTSASKLGLKKMLLFFPYFLFIPCGFSDWKLFSLFMLHAEINLDFYYYTRNDLFRSLINKWKRNKNDDTRKKLHQANNQSALKRYRLVSVGIMSG